MKIIGKVKVLGNNDILVRWNPENCSIWMNTESQTWKKIPFKVQDESKVLTQTQFWIDNESFSLSE